MAKSLKVERLRGLDINVTPNIRTVDTYAPPAAADTRNNRGTQLVNFISQLSPQLQEYGKKREKALTDAALIRAKEYAFNNPDKMVDAQDAGYGILTDEVIAVHNQGQGILAGKKAQAAYNDWYDKGLASGAFLGMDNQQFQAASDAQIGFLAQEQGEWASQTGFQTGFRGVLEGAVSSTAAQHNAFIDQYRQTAQTAGILTQVESHFKENGMTSASMQTLSDTLFKQANGINSYTSANETVLTYVANYAKTITTSKELVELQDELKNLQFGNAKASGTKMFSDLGLRTLHVDLQAKVDAIESKQRTEMLQGRADAIFDATRSVEKDLANDFDVTSAEYSQNLQDTYGLTEVQTNQLITQAITAKQAGDFPAATEEQKQEWRSTLDDAVSQEEKLIVLGRLGVGLSSNQLNQLQHIYQLSLQNAQAIETTDNFKVGVNLLEKEFGGKKNIVGGIDFTDPAKHRRFLVARKLYTRLYKQALEMGSTEMEAEIPELANVLNNHSLRLLHRGEMPEFSLASALSDPKTSVEVINTLTRHVAQKAGLEPKTPGVITVTNPDGTVVPVSLNGEKGNGENGEQPKDTNVKEVGSGLDKRLLYGANETIKVNTSYFNAQQFRPNTPAGEWYHEETNTYYKLPRDAFGRIDPTHLKLLRQQLENSTRGGFQEITNPNNTSYEDLVQQNADAYFGGGGK